MFLSSKTWGCRFKRKPVFLFVYFVFGFIPFKGHNYILQKVIHENKKKKESFLKIKIPYSHIFSKAKK